MAINPKPMTNGTWNVLMLLVDRDRQRQGHGSALMSYIEQTLRDRGERLLIVETSSLDEFEPARKFYSTLENSPVLKGKLKYAIAN